MALIPPSGLLVRETPDLSSDPKMNTSQVSALPLRPLDPYRSSGDIKVKFAGPPVPPHCSQVQSVEPSRLLNPRNSQSQEKSDKHKHKSRKHVFSSSEEHASPPRRKKDASAATGRWYEMADPCFERKYKILIETSPTFAFPLSPIRGKVPLQVVKEFKDQAS